MQDAPLRTRVRRAAKGRAPRLLLLVHGYGYHPEEMLAYGTVIDPERRFVLVAPRGPIELRNGAAAWSVPKNREPPQFVQSAEALSITLDAACARYDVERSAAIVGGFSQGAIVSFTLGLDPSTVCPAAVINWCGGLPIGRGTPIDLDRLTGVSVLWQLADRDEVVPAEFSRSGAATAAAHGAALTLREYDSTHAVTVEMLADARARLADR